MLYSEHAQLPRQAHANKQLHIKHTRNSCQLWLAAARSCKILIFFFPLLFIEVWMRELKIHSHNVHVYMTPHWALDYTSTSPPYKSMEST